MPQMALTLWDRGASWNAFIEARKPGLQLQLVESGRPSS